jgi:hypothetical protein
MSHRPLLPAWCPPLFSITFVFWSAAPADLAAQQTVSEPFVGITVDGTVTPGLYPVRATGVSTAPIVDAARAYLATLTPAQLERTRFNLESDEWRHWSNIPFANLEREGLPFRDMDEAQRQAAFDLIRSGLSARGFEEARNIMRVDGYLANLLDNHEGFGEDLYFIGIFGDPSATEPWGWQLDGHHLVVNYFVMGDQVVMSPNFWGSEPVWVDTGPYAGIRNLQEEQDRGLAFMLSLRPDQRAIATVSTEKTRNNVLAAAFRDNIEVDYTGIRADQLDESQREFLLDLIAVYAGHTRDDQARVHMEEIRQHLSETRFAWIGEVGPEALFYYRIHSPVILIEFDHTTPVSLRDTEGRGPTRNHIHITVRKPNGNDYGKDLLGQHYEEHRNDPTHRHE